jgi:phage baseplate assembly protein W
MKMVNPDYFTITPTLKRISLEEHIKNTLRGCLLTRLGERVHQPTVGSKIHELLYKPLFTSTKQELKAAVLEAISINEPRVEIEQIDISSDELDPTELFVKLNYKITETSKRDLIKFKLM